MSAGDFLQRAWDTTADAANSSMETVGDSVASAATTVEAAALTVAQDILPVAQASVRVVAVLAQLPYIGAAMLAKGIVNKVASLFSPSPSSSVNACLVSPAKILADNIKAEQALINKAIAEGKGSYPAVKSAQLHVAVCQKALMAADVYNNHQQTEIPGYHRANQADLDRLGMDPADFSPKSGMRAALYVSNDGSQYTLAFRGTDPSKTSDLLADARQALGIQSAYYDDAQSLAQQVNRSIAFNSPGSGIDLVGHSLGGGEVQAASSATGLNGTTFNAAGLNPNSVDSFDADALSARITNYTVDGEPLTTAQQTFLGLPEAAAQQVTLPAPGGDTALMELHGMTSVESGLSQSSPAIQNSLQNLSPPLMGGLP